MKTLKKIAATILTLALFLNFANANETSYKLSAVNLKYTSANSLEFDICLLNTNSTKKELKYSLGQFFLEFNPAIANGGVLSYSIVSSDLSDELKPRNANVFENQLRLATNSPSTDKSNLKNISSENTGTLIARMKLETSAEKFSETPLNLKWCNDNSLYKTKIFIYEDTRNVEITDEKNHVIDIEKNLASRLGSDSEEPSLPNNYSLSQNYPNPFNPETKIKFSLPVQANVELTVYDITGKAILNLVNQQLNPGNYEYSFDGRNFASGIYFYRIKSGNFVETRKMLLTK